MGGNGRKSALEEELKSYEEVGIFHSFLVIENERERERLPHKQQSDTVDYE